MFSCFCKICKSDECFIGFANYAEVACRDKGGSGIYAIKMYVFAPGRVVK